MDKLIDIHTHQRSAKSLAVVNYFAQDLSLDLSFDGPVSIGLHPWHLREQKAAELLRSIEAFAGNKYVVAIGECGLDRAVSINFENQMKFFLAQNQIAIENELPVIIHSVKTYSDFLQMMKDGKMQTPWIFHGFRGNFQIAKRIIDFGGYISIGSQVLKNDNKIKDVIKKVPLQRLLIETDDSRVDVELIYTKTAEIRGLKFNEFVSQIYQNFIFSFNYGFR